MTSGRRDLGNRGRAIVVAVAVGSAGVLAGWMAATDHATTTANDAANAGEAVSGSTRSSAGGSSSSSDTSSRPSFDDDNSAAPGTSQVPSAAPDARTGGS